MSILCFGGSFNPIHFGHLRCASAVAKEQRFDRVVLIPSGRPPHKNGGFELASPEDRLAMCRLAVKDDPLFAVDDLEIRRSTPSYTIDTARELRSRGWPEVNWLIGGDMLNDLPNWHEPLALLREVNFVVMARPGIDLNWDRLPRAFDVLREHLVPAPRVDISATEIRQRLASGQPVDEMLPLAVEQYIREKGLYGAHQRP